MGIGVPPVQILDPDTGLPLGTAGNPLVTSDSGSAAPSVGDILVGAATANNTIIITIPAGRTWKGNLFIFANVVNGAISETAKSADISITTAGTGVVPALGSVLARIRLDLAANTASGTAGTVTQEAVVVEGIFVTAPAGNDGSLKFNKGPDAIANGIVNGRLI